MSSKESEISPRYFIAEGSVILLGAILFAARFFGLAPSQSLPLIDVTLSDSKGYPIVVSILLIAAIFYLLVEWRQSSPIAKKANGYYFRFAFSCLWATCALWFSYPLLTQGTPYATVSPAWYLVFFLVGCVLGVTLSCLVFASLMIRTPQESARLRLPRIPIASRAQFRIWIPVTLLISVLYFVLLSFVPSSIVSIAVSIVVVTIIFILLDGQASMYLARDQFGHRILYRDQITNLKKAFDFHDYAYMVIDSKSTINKSIEFPLDRTPQDLQQALRTQSAAFQLGEVVNFQAKLLDDISIKLYAKDGNPENDDIRNCGVTIGYSHGMDEKIRVLITPTDTSTPPFEQFILTSSFAKYFENNLLSAPNPENRELLINTSLNAAVNEVVKEAVMKKVIGIQPSILHAAVQTGDELMVVELIKNKADVNEIVAGGWTPLLFAAANGYSNIVRLLLDAGANPDTANLLGRTPLMFSASYGNLEICELLLEYGADIDLLDSDGASALINSCEIGAIEIVEKFLNSGANMDFRTIEGKTALDVAYASGHGKIAKMLRI